MSTLLTIERCPDCDREWPSRLGSHNCNFRRAHIHKAAVVIEPSATLLNSVKRLTDRLETETTSSAQYADLGGLDSPYPAALSDIDATIGFLKQFRSEIQSLGRHAHSWNEDDYCVICGADGRA